MEPPPQSKPIEWVGDSKEVIGQLPKQVKVVFGTALRMAQQGGRHVSAKVLGHFGGAGVLEVVEDFDRSTYRGVYTVRLKGVVYVLHVFKKKAKKGSETPKHEMDLVRSRLKDAERHYHENYEKHER